MLALARSGRNLCILFCGFPVRYRARSGTEWGSINIRSIRVELDLSTI
jgi:hypothetical protein